MAKRISDVMGELIGLLSAFIISGEECHALMPVSIDVNGAPVITEMTNDKEEFFTAWNAAVKHEC